MKSTGAVKKYKSDLRNVVSYNQANKVHLALENTQTPDERDEIIDYLRRSARDLFLGIVDSVLILFPSSLARRLISSKAISSYRARKDWRKRLEVNRPNIGKIRKNILWTGKSLGQGLTLYKQLGKSRVPVGNAKLILGFTGKSNRMMMSLADFLDSIRPFDADVLLIEGNPETLYGDGILAYRQGLSSDVAKLKVLCKGLGYESFAAIGTSAGAVPAILSENFFNFRFILAAGPQSPHSHALPADWKKLIQKLGRDFPVDKLTILAGERSEADVQSALAWQKTLGAKVITVPSGGHACLPRFVRDPRYSAFIEENDF